MKDNSFLSKIKKKVKIKVKTKGQDFHYHALLSPATVGKHAFSGRGWCKNHGEGLVWSLLKFSILADLGPKEHSSLYSMENKH